MNTPSDIRGAFGQIALAIGLKSLERLTAGLDPDVMLAKASELVGVELKSAIMELLGDQDSTLASDLIDRFYQELDNNDVIERIAGPLATAMADYFKQETTDLVEAITAELDLDALAELVAQKIADKIQIGS